MNTRQVRSPPAGPVALLTRSAPFRTIRATTGTAFPGPGKGRDIKNIEMTVDGNILTIKVDLTKEFGPSSSGKTIIIASTEGNISIPDRDEKVGLNIYRKP